MASLADVAGVARRLSRDFGIFFEESFITVGSTLRLPHPLVEPTTVTVLNNTDQADISEFVAVNGRNGMLKVRDFPTYTDGVYVSGMHYTWFLDEDMAFFAQMIVTEHLYSRPGVSLESISGVEVEVMGIGALVYALYSLLNEFATDIDVSSPEGMNIPAHQRYQQLQGLVHYWQEMYNNKAAMLNVGLNKMEMGTLRRITRLSNRYAPVYRGREVDDPRPPVRVRPPIDPIAPTVFDAEEAFWESMDNGIESFDFGYGGWNSVGSSG